MRYEQPNYTGIVPNFILTIRTVDVLLQGQRFKRALTQFLDPSANGAVKESLRKAEPADEDERPDEIYYSRERISRCAMVIITFMIIVLMILPIYLLLCRVNGTEGELTRHDTAMCIVILLFFTLAFSAMLVSFTSAKRHEVLGAAAAYIHRSFQVSQLIFGRYCAILVVFFGNLGVGAS